MRQLIRQKKIDFSTVSVSVKNNKTKTEFGTYTPNLNSGKYVMILPPGDYTIDIAIDGFEKYSEKLMVADKVGGRQDIEKNIVLLPAGYQKPVEQPKVNKQPGTKSKSK